MATLHFIAGCAPAPFEPSPKPDDLDPVAEAVRDLTGRRTRVVWLQDIGDGADYLARGTNLHMMGLDTDDGQGPRILLTEGRNMVKPMFTVDGHRIVFSDRHNATMHIVNWAGGDAEELGTGFALHTWRDPKTRIEWLYYAKPPVDDDKYLATHEAIYRKALAPFPRNWHTLYNRLCGRLRERRAWTQTHVSEDSYQLSADGRFASAAFPWPEVGVHDMHARRWIRHGRGCWVAMSPDNSYLFWIFDGAHRNLMIERGGLPGTDRWTVPVNQLPDTDRYEVYHPRWSNHPRIMAVTGPYKAGEGAHRLPGGGADVEIWMGRFAENHQAIEQWARVTYNNYANFYPDVWVETDPRAHVPAADAPSTRPRQLEWPSNRDGLVYLWEHGAAQNEIALPETGRKQIFRPEPRRHARFGGRHDMWLQGGYFLDSDAPTLKPPFAIEMAMATKEGAAQSGWILGYDADHAFTAQDGELIFRWNGESVRIESEPEEPFTHLVINVTHTRVDIYVNGARHMEALYERGAQPAPAAPLFFGGHPEMDADWQGRLSNIAFYRRELDPAEVARNHRLFLEHVQRLEVPVPKHVRARVVNQSAIPSPADIAPYLRALVVNEYEFADGDRTGERFLAAHWAILDGIVLDTAVRPVGAEYTLSITPYDDRPELEGERLAMDSEDFMLELFYDLNL